jgi:hypothetical protein
VHPDPHRRIPGHHVIGPGDGGGRLWGERLWGGRFRPGLFWPELFWPGLFWPGRGPGCRADLAGEGDQLARGRQHPLGERSPQLGVQQVAHVNVIIGHGRIVPHY